MRIFTKKSFRFRNKENGASITTAPLSFHDVPDWIKLDPIYDLAVSEGSIELMEGKQRQKELENNPNTKKTDKKEPAGNQGNTGVSNKP